jgi:hypothetical protein
MLEDNANAIRSVGNGSVNARESMERLRSSRQ